MPSTIEGISTGLHDIAHHDMINRSGIDGLIAALNTKK